MKGKPEVGMTKIGKNGADERSKTSVAIYVEDVVTLGTNHKEGNEPEERRKGSISNVWGFVRN